MVHLQIEAQEHKSTIYIDVHLGQIVNMPGRCDFFKIRCENDHPNMTISNTCTMGG